MEKNHNPYLYERKQGSKELKISGLNESTKPANILMLLSLSIFVDWTNWKKREKMHNVYFSFSGKGANVVLKSQLSQDMQAGIQRTLDMDEHG